MVPAFCFVLTVALEWVVLAWYSKLGFARTGWFCLCMNGVTWGVLMGVLTLWPVPVPLMELAVIVAEAALLRWYWEWRPSRAFLGSVLMNLTSWLIGGAMAEFILRRL